jgi:hypothetical protein
LRETIALKDAQIADYKRERASIYAGFGLKSNRYRGSTVVPIDPPWAKKPKTDQENTSSSSSSSSAANASGLPVDGDGKDTNEVEEEEKEEQDSK